jgi:CRISPR/Cas system Type II protein with McrA/HNH and RuvC-like nuclease domain
MRKILGIDIGTNSIGWALVDADANKIIGLGAKIINSEREALRIVKRSSRRSIKNQSLQKKYLHWHTILLNTVTYK